MFVERERVSKKSDTEKKGLRCPLMRVIKVTRAP